MASNCYRVPKSQWKKWDRLQQAAFNRVFAALKHQNVPFGRKVFSPRDWSMCRFNIAWLAAEELGMKSFGAQEVAFI